MELLSLLYGIYPRSENLRRTYAKWERGKLNSKDVSSTVVEESSIYYNLLKEASLDYFTDPLFNWYDIFRPLILSIDGMRLGPLVRYKETNTFYRQPIIKNIGKIKEISEFKELEDNPPLPLFNEIESGSYLYFLPGINSLIRMSSFSGDTSETMNGLVEAYLKIIEVKGIERLLIYEPLEDADLKIYDKITEASSVFLVASDGVKNTGPMTGSKFYSIISDDPYQVIKFCEIPGIKVVDATSTKLDEKILEKVRRYSTDFDRLIVSNNEIFDFLPRIIADKKIFTFKGEI